ncbi:kinetochore-associated protein DSN1 homolog isoform X2 [Festucalex cinctus]
MKTKQKKTTFPIVHHCRKGAELFRRAMAKKQFEEKMAEESSSAELDSCGSVAAVEATNEVKQSPKRCLSPSAPDGVPPKKSPRVELLLADTQMLNQHPDTEGLEMACGSTEKPEFCPPARMKSWRRATMTRRSLSIPPKPYQSLYESINTSLSQQERLSMLMEAAMKLATDKLQNSLQSVPNSSLESFQKKVEKLKKKCKSVAITSEQQTKKTGELGARTATVIENTIKRIRAESQSWDALSHKHRTKAEELERKLAQGQKEAMSLDHTCMAQSLQYQLIQSKPDYRGRLHRLLSELRTMAPVVMDAQCKLARDLQSVKKLAQLVVKETSGRLAAQAGFQDHSDDIIRDILHLRPLTTSARTQSD